MSEPTDIDNEEEEFAESTLIQAIENQIESDNPPAAKATFNKLTLVGYERDDILQVKVRNQGGSIGRAFGFDALQTAAQGLQ